MPPERVRLRRRRDLARSAVLTNPRLIFHAHARSPRLTCCPTRLSSSIKLSLMSSNPDSGSTCVHLLVLIHGMWGNPVHLAEMRRVMEEHRGQATSEKGPGGEQLRVLVAETNKDDSTYDGIDWGGERVAEEVSRYLYPAGCAVYTKPPTDLRRGQEAGERWQEGDPLLRNWVQSRRSHRALCGRVRCRVLFPPL